MTKSDIQAELNKAANELNNGGDAVDTLVDLMDHFDWGKGPQGYFYDRFTDDTSHYCAEDIVNGTVIFDSVLSGF